MSSQGLPLRRREVFRAFQLRALFFSVLLALIMAVFVFTEAVRLQESVYLDSEKQGRFLFSTLGFQISDAIYFNNIEKIRVNAERLTSQNTVQKIAVFADDGRLLFDSSQSHIPTGFIDSELLVLALNTDDVLYRRTKEHIQFIGAIRFGGDTLGGICFELSVRQQLSDTRQALLKTGITGTLLVILCSFLSFAVASISGTRRSLKRVESNFRELTEQSPLPCSIYARDGQVRYSNPAMHRLMDRRDETRPVNNSGYNILHDKHLIELGLIPTIKKGFTGGAEVIPPFLYLDAGQNNNAAGHPLWLSATVFPLLDADGETSEVVVIYEDMTEQKQLEREGAELNDQLLQSEKLEGLGIMARGIAHDFNNLLTPILGNADLLQLDLEPSSDEWSMLDSIKMAAIRASELCDQMLIYAGQANKQKKPTDVSKEISDLGKLIRSSIPKRISFSQNLTTDLPLIMADQTRLRSIIFNLLINAAEAIDGKTGDISLVTGKRLLAASDMKKLLPAPDMPPGEYVYLEVTDTGSGMDKITQEKLFDPFFSTKFAGRGLGMSAVLGIIGEHQGGITVQSEPGKGSSFVVYFPINKAQA